MVFQYLESTLHTFVAATRQTSDKLSGCWEQPLLKVLGKSVGLCKTSKRKDLLYISLPVSVWRIICENFNPNGLIFI